MKNSKMTAALTVMAAMSLVCTGCSTSASTNAQTYNREVSAVLNTWFGSSSDSKTNNTDTESSDTNRLDMPVDFTLAENGDYSFTGVANADYYLIYFCEPDATGDRDAFQFSSDAIEATGDGGESYSGNVSDALQYAYGEYLVKVFAFPDVNDSEHSMSTAATAEFSCSGAQDAPTIDYLWNIFTGSIDVQLSNINAYTYEVYPDSVDVVFTNVDDRSDSVTVTIEDLSADSYSVTADTLTQGTTYDITAVSHSASAFVTNPDSDETVVATGVTFGESNVMSAGYSYTDGIARNSFNYPQVMENISLTEVSTTAQNVQAFGTLAAHNFTTTPVETQSGSAYSYSVAWDGMWAFDNGTIELYADGTFQFNQYAEMPPQGPSTIQGSWVDNGDGTVTLSYDHTTLKTSVD